MYCQPLKIRDSVKSCRETEKHTPVCYNKIETKNSKDVFSMNSISQKYSLEFNNCIKNKIFNSINEIGENILLSILKSTQEKYLNFVSTIEENIKNLILNIIKETISFFDEKFRN